MIPRNPSPDPDHLFDIRKLNKWFAISSLILVGALICAIWQDYNREWKHWQRKFRSIQQERTAKDIGIAHAELASNPDYQKAQLDVGAAAGLMRGREVEVNHLEREIRKLEGDRYRYFTAYQVIKSKYDASVYELEEAHHREAQNVVTLDHDLQKTKVELDRRKAQYDAAERAKADAQVALDRLVVSKKTAETSILKFESQLLRLDRRREKIKPSFVNDVVRNAPFLDFIDPSLKVKELVLPELRSDQDPSGAVRADSCLTCHVAIDQPGFESQSNPLRTHPRLDLYLGATSPHPVGRFGCTVCHLGQGGGLTFTTAAHTPRDEDQAGLWKERYGWRRMSEWPEPMLQSRYTQGACLGCHAEDVEIPSADRLNKGIRIIERAGCYGCHKIAGWQKIRKPAPALGLIGSKVTRDFMLKWIRRPREYRPTANMPQIFDLPNSSDPESKSRADAEVWAIVSYLRAGSKPYHPAFPGSGIGDVGRGKELFGKIGCLGCHRMDDFPNVRTVAEALNYKIRRPVGPELNGVGSKLTYEWLSAWLKNPKDYWPSTHMPAFRLSDREIADLAAYLLSKKNSSFDALPIKRPTKAQTRAIALDYMKHGMVFADAEARLARMNDDDVEHWLGERAIARYGCYGCHEIPGFEHITPIGPELTMVGSKPLVDFDFGFVDIPKAADTWVRNKLDRPRSYDIGKSKEALDRLRMPYFEFTNDELDGVVTFVMGLRTYDIPEAMKPARTSLRVAKREGRRLAHDLNCRGCHVLEDRGGEILANYADHTQGPPNLKREGRKVQPSWLYEFLARPHTVRPWLDVRMPTFGFDPDDRNRLIRYFRALENMELVVEDRPKVELSGEALKFSRDLFGQLKCVRCHVAPPYPTGTKMIEVAPSLRSVVDRLRPEYVEMWLKNPQELIPHTRMPNLFYLFGRPLYPDSDTRLRAVRDWLFSGKVYSTR